MTNDIYRIDILAAGTDTVTITDDGSGSDWLVLAGTYADATDIRLNYTNSFPSQSALGLFYLSGSTHRLVVNGLIENVRGCDSADAIAGNELNNILYGDQASTGVGGNDTIDGQDGRDTVYGGIGADVVNGGAGNDLLFGDEGNDTISGSYDADTIDGGLGADSLAGGANAGDTVSYARSTSGISLDITYGNFTTGHGGDAEGDQVIGFFNVIGTAFDDVVTDTVKTTIAFGYNDNVFYGGAGNDLLTLGGGKDRGEGGIGDDTILGEADMDTLLGGSGNDQLSLGDSRDTGDGGAGDDTVLGGGGNDKLLGGLGADRLDGGIGADTITGGAGKDVLIGGGGADRFVFSARTDSSGGSADHDAIRDFSHAQGDKIDLHLMDAIAATGANDAFSFIGTAAFTGAGQIRIEATTGGLLVLANQDADATPEFSIFLANVSTLGAADFIL